MINDVKKKLDKESAEIKEMHASAMKGDVRNALLEFCAQSEEFCRAVEQGGSFKDCMAAVAKKCGNCISDLEAFRRAVAFYFPTATIHFEMKINTEGNNALEADSSAAAPSAITMSLDDLPGM